MVSFNEISSTNRLPTTLIEFDNSRALALQPGELHRTLLIGIMLAAGSATPNVVVDVPGGESAADPLAGEHSQLAAMSRAYRRVDSRSKLALLPVVENGAGVQATGTVALSGTATKDGTLSTRIGDRVISTFIAKDTAAAAAATAHAASINAAARLPATAAAATSTVTLTARHKGEGGNAIALKSISAPAGITPTVTPMASGATNPSLAAAIAAIDPSRYDTIVTAFTDAASIALLEAELDRRWSPPVKKPGHVFGAIRGTYGALGTAGAARNSQRSTIIGAGLIPTPPWVVAAQAAAWDARVSSSQPNQPRAGLVMPDVMAPDRGDELDDDERNALLYTGISTLEVDPSGRVAIERLITTYQKSASGTADASYLDIGIVRNLAQMYIEWLALGAKHRRDLIAPDGTSSAPGVPLTTPKELHGELVANYRSRERRGLCKDTAGFAAELIVEIDEQDPERVKVHATPRLVLGLVTIAIKVSYQL